MKKQFVVPRFASEDEEREFWAEISLSDHYEPSEARPAVFPNLKPASQPVPIRFPVSVLDALKERASKIGVPFRRRGS